MPSTYPRDRFDEVPHESGRVGAHRAENPGMRGVVVFLWAAVATIVLVIAGVLGFLYLSQQGALPAPTDDPAPVETTAAAIDTSYTVLVLNGTATEGLDDEVAAELVAAGFAEDLVIPTDSSSTDFAETTVYYADAVDEAVARGVAEAIGASEVVQSTAYQNENPEQKELTVVVGLDRVSAG
ncbi:LytR C-terminal domain-containing protein [Microbacterium betulae]|uniref:LytR C-terminal domain-containing protein n=1 Tax=Microbacterium betulae TaxID=2981139 RepID=A0AA97FKQ5_9MICO|nr:LytR C-terminal domain-containing protein [Microbacterium sp. AB]WOF23874.1 LytR C-terminal domain-containing protein [Microbacterium sp. AB]